MHKTNSYFLPTEFILKTCLSSSLHVSYYYVIICVKRNHLHGTDKKKTKHLKLIYMTFKLFLCK